MQKIYMLIGREKLFLYEKEGDRYIPQYIEGSLGYGYSISTAKQDIKKLLNILTDEYSLNTEAELEFVVLENENDVYSRVIQDVLGDLVVQELELGRLLYKIISNLQKDEKLHIEEFGVNFDGKNYIEKKSKLFKRNFSLLGYTVGEDEFMKFID